MSHPLRHQRCPTVKIGACEDRAYPGSGWRAVALRGAVASLLLACNAAIAFEAPGPCQEDPCDEACISISITADPIVVAEGGTVNLTVSVSPNTDVEKVVLSYEGESGQDEDSTAPYTFSHTFNDAMLDLTVTATVEFVTQQQDCTATLDIDVVGLTITGPSSPTRGTLATYICESAPTGLAIDRFDWSYGWSGDSNTHQDNDTDQDDKSQWAGVMVEDGTISCSATVLGVSIQTPQQITITPRSWSTPITCAQDNESGWGDEPTVGAPLGQNRDRDSDTAAYIFVPRNGDTFTPARTLAEVASGPCEGWWYVSSTILICQRETVINRYIKSAGPAPSGSSTCFFDRNDLACFDAGDFLQAVKNHEYRGTPPTARSLEGHQGRIENAIIDQGYDPRTHIEDLTRRDEQALASAVDQTIRADEDEVESFGGDESYMDLNGPNWGGWDDPESLGYGLNSRWSGTAWTICNNGPKDL